ncbi:S8 family serine peptidase [Paenibacillus antibioticophila]
MEGEDSDFGGVSFIEDTFSYYDDNGHGTHVAGIIGAQLNGVEW